MIGHYLFHICDLYLNIVIQIGVFILSYKHIHIQVHDRVIIFQTSTIVLQSHVKMAVAALTWSMATAARVLRDTSAEIARLVRCISTFTNRRCTAAEEMKSRNASAYVLHIYEGRAYGD